ncbi:MAG: ammonium transporter [Fibrobacteraceae bacterium]
MLILCLVLATTSAFADESATEPAAVATATVAAPAEAPTIESLASDKVIAETNDDGTVISQKEENDTFSKSLTAIWLLVCGALVFFMQPGFAMVECGLCRAKNANNILMKNVLDFCIGSVVFFFVGWGLMYGKVGLEAGKFIGFSDFLVHTSGDMLSWFFQVVFCATAATIVSGAMAERTKFSSYLVYSLVISAVVYPVSGHWIWGGGWLSELGFHDFAGSTVVHSVGAWSAMMGAIIVGPRIGKYVKGEDGKIHVRAIQGHNMPLVTLGVFILWFAWYGFNCGSTLSGLSHASMAHVAVTTTLAAAMGTMAAMFTSWIIGGKPDISMTLNGSLAGLVAITAPCDVVSPEASLVIGLVAGILVVLSVMFFEQVLHIDDPVGAISVHGINGAWGTLATGIFGDLAAMGGVHTRLGQIGVQSLGIVSVFLWVTITTGILFLILKKTIGLRVSDKEQLRGLDIGEHGSEAYSGFQFFSNV